MQNHKTDHPKRFAKVLKRPVKTGVDGAFKRPVNTRKKIEIEYECNYCGEKFKNSIAFQKHTEAQHGDSEPFKCKFEGCDFKTNK